MGRGFTRYLCLLICVSIPGPAVSADVQLLLLSPQKAIFLLDGERRVLAPGEQSPEGLHLVSIEGDTVVVEIGGETRHLGLSRRLVSKDPLQSPGDESTPAGPDPGGEFRVFADNQGMFRTTGSVNGFPVNFIVDTGATTVVLNASAAKRLGIDYRMDGRIVAVSTASRVERGYLVNLRSVKLGPIEVLNVAATVIDGDYPAQALLGMSFLGRLESQRTASMLVLKKPY